MAVPKSCPNTGQGARICTEPVKAREMAALDQIKQVDTLCATGKTLLVTLEEVAANLDSLRLLALNQGSAELSTIWQR